MEDACKLLIGEGKTLLYPRLCPLLVSMRELVLRHGRSVEELACRRRARYTERRTRIVRLVPGDEQRDEICKRITDRPNLLIHDGSHVAAAGVQVQVIQLIVAVHQRVWGVAWGEPAKQLLLPGELAIGFVVRLNVTQPSARHIESLVRNDDAYCR
jgi:hypothetical protein